MERFTFSRHMPRSGYGYGYGYGFDLNQPETHVGIFKPEHPRRSAGTETGSCTIPPCPDPLNTISTNSSLTWRWSAT